MIYSGEINYEKLYKDALERAKKIDIDEAYASQGTIAKTIFPELAESEDERIRKGLVEALKTSKTVGELKFTLPEPTREECITYLEKQKEQKHPNGCFTCDEYKKGYEEGRRNGFTAGYNKAMKEVEQKEQKPLTTEETELNSIAFLEQMGYTCIPPGKEQKPVDNISKEEYAKRFKALCDAYEIKLPNREYDIYHLCDDLSKLSIGSDKQKPVEKQDYSGLNDLERAIHRGFLSAGVENVPVTIIKETAKECLAQMKPAKWGENDENMLNSIINVVCGVGIQSNGGLREKQVSWLKSLPERFNFQPKEEWSEEKKQTTKNTHPEEYPLSPAECILPREYGLFKQLQQECIETIEQELYSLGKEHEKDDDSRIKFLKSLRPSWKPSEEQMSMLLAVINDPNNAGAESCYMALKSIYNNLKKL